MRSPPNRPVWLAVLVVGLIAAGWVIYDREAENVSWERGHALTGGDPHRGAARFAAYGCGACHSVSGVPGATGHVGPPLDGIGSRAIIAGELENRPDNLMRWIMNPQSVEPGVDMPNLGVSPADARDIAAFLYTRT